MCQFDDIFRLTTGVSGARAGNVKVDTVMNQKQLELNDDKTTYILCGDPMEIKMNRKELEIAPLMCGDIVTKEKKVEKYLGDMIAGSLSECVLATIADREGKVRAAMIEAKTLVEDFRADSVGAVEVGLVLWEAAMLPTCLYNCSAWTEMGKVAENKLEDLQYQFLRLLLAVPRSCPKVALRQQTGMLSMRYRVWVEEIMFVHHLRRLDSQSLASRVYHEQLSNGWPGLTKEVTDICTDLLIESVHDTNLDKKEYKKVVLTACVDRDRMEMKQVMEEMSKCEDIINNDFKAQHYILSNTLVNQESCLGSKQR